MRTAPLASLALALAACGDPLFFAEVEDELICMTLPGQTIPAAPAGIGEHTVGWEGSLDLGSAIPGLGEKGTTGTIKSVSLRVDSTTNMSVIRHAEVSVYALDGETPTPYMHYEAQQTPDPHVLAMTIDADLDLFQRLAGGKKIEYYISFTGAPPTVAWTADITACMSAKVTIDPLEAMKN